MRRLIATSIAIAALMGCAAAAALGLKPRTDIAVVESSVNLADWIPTEFPGWTLDEESLAGVVNPQANELANRIYSQVLSRTFVDSESGERVMLSIAYGGQQRDTRQIHLPDVCYPAQGFQILSASMGTLDTEYGSIPVRRLIAAAGERVEPITYWVTIGERVVFGDINTKIEQIRHRAQSSAADGLIVRVSSISRNEGEAFALQQRFVSDLLRGVSAEHLPRLAGLRREFAVGRFSK